MSSLLEQLKVDLTFFAEQAMAKGVRSPLIFKGPAILSAEVYELLAFLNDQLEKHRLLHRFDFRFRSGSITESFGPGKFVEPFRKEDYVLPFLHHLAIQDDKVSAEDLHVYINGFLKKHSECLSVHDIFILATGVSRAVANICFALTFLRKYCLIENRTVQGRRSLRPTMFGILTLILIKLQMKEITDDDKIYMSTFYRHLCMKYTYTYLPWMGRKTPEEIISVLETFMAQLPELKNMDKIRALVWEYYKVISSMLRLDLVKGTIKKQPYFDEKFMQFIKSDTYNWDHSDSIIVLCNGYRDLWGLNKKAL